MSLLGTTKWIRTGLGVATALTLAGCSRPAAVEGLPPPAAKTVSATADANGVPYRAIDFTLVDTRGTRVRLSTYRRDAPLILEFFGPD